MLKAQRFVAEVLEMGDAVAESLEVLCFWTSHPVRCPTCGGETEAVFQESIDLGDLECPFCHRVGLESR